MCLLAVHNAHLAVAVCLSARHSQIRAAHAQACLVTCGVLQSQPQVYKPTPWGLHQQALLSLGGAKGGYLGLKVCCQPSLPCETLKVGPASHTIAWAVLLFDTPLLGLFI